MISKIDWLSFTLPIGQGDAIQSHWLWETIVEELYSFSPIAAKLMIGGYKFEPRKGRPPYSMGFARADAGLYIFGHPTLSHVLFELSGAGCDALSLSDDAADFLAHIAPRLTRIDLASDMLCGTDPFEFVFFRNEGRFKTHSEFKSSSGTTCYVGSRTSNRYARVYRYNEPHERAHLLRAEHVLKGQEAKNTALSVLEHGVEATVNALGEAFGWHHADWQPHDVKAAEIATWRPERRSGKTVYWLNSQVAPVLVRLHRDGVLDVERWLRDNVLGKLSSMDDEP